AGVGGEEGAAGAEGELIHEVAEVPAGEGGEYEIVEEIVGEGEGSGVGAEAGAGVGVGGEEGAAGAEGELIHEVAEVPAGEGGEYEIVEEIVGEGEGAGVGAEAEVGAGVGGEEGVAGAEGEGGEYEIVEEIVGEGEGAGVGAEAEAGAGVGGEEGVAGAAGEGGEYEIVEEIVGEGEGAGIGAEAEAGIGGEEGGAGAAGEGGEYEIVEEIVGEGEGAGIGAEAEAGIGGEEGGAGAAGEGGEYEIVEEIVGEGEGDGVGAEAEAGAGIGGEEGVTGAAGEGGEYEIVEEIVGEGEGAGVGGEEGAAVAEGELIQEVAAAGREESIRETISHIENVLQDSGLNAADKISKILSAVNEMVGEALSTGGLGQDGEDLARLRDLMNNIKDNLDVFSREDISGLEVIEEIVDEGARAVEEAEGEEIAETTGAGLEAVPGVGEGGLVWGEPGVEGAGGESLEELEAAEGVGQEEKEAGPEEPELEEEIIEEEGEGEGSEISGFPEEVQEAQMEAVGGQEPADHGVAEGVLGQPDEGQETKGPEIIEEEGEGEAGGSSITVIASDGVVDGDLREKTDLLTRLAEAASVLQGLGPDLNSSVYTEEQIRGNARFLSEEFDRYLSMRDKYYNSHVLVQGGDYLVGGAHLAKSVLEEQIVVLQDYYIGKFPVTNAVFEIFVEQTGYITMAEKYGFSLVYYPRMQRSRDPLTGAERFSLHSQAYSKKVPGACWHKPFGPDSSLHMKRSHPVVHVSFDDAQAFAAWTGKRLPTEIEWEAAARTPRGLVYPWGNQWQEGSCNIEQSLHGDTTSVDRYIKHANAAEVADMLGNVLEWTCDVIGDQETSDMHIVKGASWISSSEISLIDRHYIEKTTASNILGFRCVAI
ncbi:MAG: SUMF1/EgtB/PvdO family nonheme iron enzyme, partial [Syntrophaceae bacterium]|nr:SUMF1/EgtB/PvdO family nonheme iron enzyme [Syntrophaceae bacterium]